MASRVFFKKIGGIPVSRSKHTKMTDQLADAAKSRDTFYLCITPEGTRSRNPNWKKVLLYCFEGWYTNTVVWIGLQKTSHSM